MSSTSLKERLLYYFQSISLLKNDFLCREGDIGEGFFILAHGRVCVSKKMEMKSEYYKSENINICTIERPTVLCEEVVL